MWSDRGFATCINGLTGKTLWRERVGGDYSGSPVRAGDRLFAVSVDGEVVVLAAADKYELLGAQSTQRNMPQHAGDRVGTNVRSESENRICCRLADSRSCKLTFTFP